LRRPFLLRRVARVRGEAAAVSNGLQHDGRLPVGSVDGPVGTAAGDLANERRQSPWQSSTSDAP
jgi:hypothetical protein